MKPITPEEQLSQNDVIMSELIIKFGPSHILNTKRQPFDALTKAVISQQLSNSASNSITERLIKIHGHRPFNEHTFMSLNDKDLRECGISNNKIKTLKGIAIAVINKELTINSFQNLSDLDVQKKLVAYWGIGPWTAEMFMIFCLKRLDIFSFGDAGLQRAHSLLYPEAHSLEQTSENWRPYRSIAAGYLWKFLDNP